MRDKRRGMSEFEEMVKCFLKKGLVSSTTLGGSAGKMQIYGIDDQEW